MTGTGAAALKGVENIGMSERSQVNSTFDSAGLGLVFLTGAFCLIVEASESHVCLLWSVEVSF